MAESPYYREILKDLIEKFGKDSIGLYEYAEYLGLGAERVQKLIMSGYLPGMVKKCSERNVYIIPVRSIAVFEANAAKTRGVLKD